MSKGNSKISNGVNNKNIIIIGPQGSGKGTQADIISAKFNIPHISTGDIFRQNIKKKTKLGEEIKSFTEQGHLVPDEITNAVIKKRLEQKDCQKGFVLDGFPRNLEQANFLDSITNISLVLEIWISDKESIKRISGRRTCPKCGKIYHLDFNPSKKKNICDECGEKLIIRADDKPKAIAKRLKIYHNETSPLVSYYKKKKIHAKINGAPAITKVTREIMKVLE